MAISTLSDLEKELAQASKGDVAIEAIRRFSTALSNTGERVAVFNAENALVNKAIRQEDAQALGFNHQDDCFVLLQGDIITAESAYYLGERVTGNPKYTVLSSSCDLVPERRTCASLLRVTEIRKSEPDAGAKLNLLLQFKRTDSMYLPPLAVDGEDVICNAVQFDGICQIRSSELLLANRIASLSLVGWRIFSFFSRMVIGRSNPREGVIRSAIENQPVQESLELLK